ncbi:MAG: hypothetical protein A2498_07985 [Lentisphaerae bacterium RIFOXYC12_FULL_60_16]|nr:MAG: hypothetical protein A2498_07985 [Lentisphaerae bacterium RIFOXYC12_FULL_60_16]OGV83766.1 MAG: hypothetical protein A2340_11145 [Lentisphaerae bacterium RIFOXYB12_FULL_60_10]
MSEHKSLADQVTTVDEARSTIRALEEKLDESIRIILRRDESLEIAERRIADLEEMVENLRERRNRQ